MAARLVSAAFPSGDDLAAAYRRLSAAYEQTLRYAADVKGLYQQVQRSIYQSLLGLANALEAKDPYTRGHSERVAFYSQLMARHLGMSEDEVERVHLSGIIHDVGKIGIEDRILRKPARLGRAPERPAHAPRAAIPWHRPSSGPACCSRPPPSRSSSSRCSRSRGR